MDNKCEIKINKYVTRTLKTSRVTKNELDKIFKTDYYGTLEQIDNEMLIMENVFVKDNCEMKYNESIEEWYLRIYDLTKEE